MILFRNLTNFSKYVIINMSSKIIDINNKNMRIQEILTEVGLTKNKGTVYLALLQLGTSGTQEIANKAGLLRTTTHEILQQLVGLGLVSYVTRGRSRIYTVESPEKLKYVLKEKEKHLDSVLPEIFSLFNTKGLRPKVRFYEGVAGVKMIFENTLTVSTKVLRGILSMSDLFKIPGREFMQDYTSRRIQAGIKLEVIRSEANEVEEVWPSSNREIRELHYAAKDMIFPMTMYFYDNKVAIIGTEKENFGMIIESSDFYQNQINFFKVLWQVTRVAKKID